MHQETATAEARCLGAARARLAENLWKAKLDFRGPATQYQRESETILAGHGVPIWYLLDHRELAGQDVGYDRAARDVPETRH